MLTAVHLAIALATAPTNQCPWDLPAPAPVQPTEARRLVEAYWSALRAWCAAPAGSAPLEPVVAQAMELAATLEGRRMRGVETGLEGDSQRDQSDGPFRARFPPGITMPYLSYFVLDPGAFATAAQPRGTKDDRIFWEAYESFVWRDDSLHPSNAVRRGLMEPGDEGCLLLGTTDLVRAVAALLQLEAIAKGPAYRALAAARRTEVLDPLVKAAKAGGCLCGEVPNLEPSLNALAAADKDGPEWKPFARAATGILVGLRTPGRFTVVVDHSCVPRTAK